MKFIIKKKQQPKTTIKYVVEGAEIDIGTGADYSLYDIMTRARIILKNRKKGDKSPINLIINNIVI